MSKKAAVHSRKSAHARKPAKAKARQDEQPSQLVAEEEALMEGLAQRLEGKMKTAVRQMVRRLMQREPGEIFGPGEFELRDSMNILTAQLVEEVVNARGKSKKGVPGS